MTINRMMRTEKEFSNRFHALHKPTKTQHDLFVDSKISEHQDSRLGFCEVDYIINIIHHADQNIYGF